MLACLRLPPDISRAVGWESQRSQFSSRRGRALQELDDDVAGSQQKQSRGRNTRGRTNTSASRYNHFDCSFRPGLLELTVRERAKERGSEGAREGRREGGRSREREGGSSLRLLPPVLFSCAVLTSPATTATLFCTATSTRAESTSFVSHTHTYIYTHIYIYI